MQKPRQSSSVWRLRRLSGLTKNCIEAVALCREYSFMLREFQDFSCRLLLCNISAGWCG
ncbi:RepA leader peptide Tap [Yersinia ruckeri]|uniref:RepA leader peptide Tap n=1 Tax=Yersinia ruckeri TaxID=29486 RepID=UPI003BF56BC4